MSTAMAPDHPHFRICAPRNMPEHAWPSFPDFERYPELRGKAPSWWRWYEMRGTNVRAAIHVVTGSSGYDAQAIVDGRDGYPKAPLHHAVVASGSREAMLAAFRLLTGAPAPGEGSSR